MKIFSINIFGFTLAPSYYGLMYAIGFILGYWILLRRKKVEESALDSLIMYIFFWVMLGGRLGYVLFYNLSYYIDNPSKILAFWNGGMSFHGGVIWVIIAMLLFSLIHKKNFYLVADEVTAVLPLWLGLGRIGNYLNKELLGRPYDGFLAIEKNGLKYFPTPLLESFLEGIVLWCILLYIRNNKTSDGQVGWAFLFFYGIFRFAVEFIRLPDVQLGYLAFWWVTMWHILSIPMILFWLYYWKVRNRPLITE
jgi:phosphatidylglycerol:prolipoprotein diacylglycerol transferase